MRLSAFSVLDSYDGRGDDRPAELLDLADAAERSGLYGLWVAEHHFQEAGSCPSPAVLLAAVAARTRALRLGPMACTVPLHHPVAIAEEYALLDRLSGGRLRLGLGSGYLGLEFEGFGVDLADRRAILDRSLGVIDRLLTTGAVDDPERATAPLRLNIRPVQRPRPPIWVPAQHAESLDGIAARGYSSAVLPYATIDDLAGVRDLVRRFRAARAAGSSPEFGVVLHLYAGPEPNRARRALQRYLDSRMAFHDRRPTGTVPALPRPLEAARIERSGFALFGDPDEFAATVQELRSMGVDEVLGMFDFGGLPVPDIRESVGRWSRALPNPEEPASEPAPATGEVTAPSGPPGPRPPVVAA